MLDQKLAPFEADCLKGLPGIRHGFFTRQGGVSADLYATLNCGPGSKDDSASVAENRARVAHYLHAHHPDVVTLYQVHSGTAVSVSAPITGERPKADAIVTATRGLAIGVLTADCTPVLFADPGAGVVGAAHAGWRGAVAGVLEATVAEMERLGAQRARIRAAIGPTINQDSYEVGPEFEAELIAISPANSRYFVRAAPDARAHFDLPGYVEGRLAAAHLHMIERQTPCTYRNESILYSFRRSQHRHEPDYGRQISAIVVA
jgi:YfiH family protein